MNDSPAVTTLTNEDVDAELSTGSLVSTTETIVVIFAELPHESKTVNSTVQSTTEL